MKRISNVSEWKRTLLDSHYIWESSIMHLPNVLYYINISSSTWKINIWKAVPKTRQTANADTNSEVSVSHALDSFRRSRKVEENEKKLPPYNPACLKNEKYLKPITYETFTNSIVSIKINPIRTGIVGIYRFNKCYVGIVKKVRFLNFEFHETWST